MGIMDVVAQMASQFGGAESEKAQVAGGLVQELESQPGSIGGIFHRSKPTASAA